MFILDDIAKNWIQGSAAKDAANTQAAAAREAAALQKQMYDQTRADTSSYRDAGGRAILGMEDKDFQRDFTMADFQADPGYAFRMQQGQKALERSKAAKGLLGSGGTLKALNDYGQGMGAQEYQSAYNRFNADRDRRFGRLGQIAGFGERANSLTASAGQNYANQAGQRIADAGSYDAAGKLGVANAWNQGISDVAESGMTMAQLAMGMPPTAAGGGGKQYDFSNSDGQGGGITEKGPSWFERIIQGYGK